MAIIVPNAASTYTADSNAAVAANRWAWLGFVPTAGGSGGSMVWLAGSTSGGSPLLPIVVASALGCEMFGPFNSPVGFYAASITGGSAVLWVRSAS